MTKVAEKCPYVIDTHARTHSYAIINTRTGARESCQAFPVTTAGVNRAIAWIGRNTAGPVLAAVEATRSYGATITSALTGQNTEVAEVKPPRRQARAGVGKNDEIDATAAAMSVLGQDVTRLLQPRSDGVRAAISILLTSRQRIDTHRTMDRNALNTLAREFDLGIDARSALTNRQIVEIAGWRTRATDTVAQRYARAEAVLLAPRSVPPTSS